ncbi:MAG: radical SAM family heme chaperone HemW [Planctomycetota bacterium]
MEVTHPESFDSFRPKSSPRSAYIHIPFCRQRCGYCNFALVADRDRLINPFLDALETELGWLDREFELDTLFLGGGTPSHLNEQQLERLAAIIGSRFSLTTGAEFTAECNPNDLNAKKAELLAGLGVNRISLGVQSFQPGKLKQLERTHGAKDVFAAIEQARTFARSVSIDLIFAAPNETMEQWEWDLKTAVSARPDHVSAYELTFEPGTQFFNRLKKGKLNEADEELRRVMYETAMEKLATGGFLQYEVSSFARSEHRCQHNLIYWSGNPYFAFGPGASRFVDGVRETNHSGTSRYINRVLQQKSPVVDRDVASGRDRAIELLWVGLRRNDGWDCNQFREKTGFGIPELLSELLPSLANRGLVEIDSHFRLTAEGRMVADWVTSEIHDLSSGD